MYGEDCEKRRKQFSEIWIRDRLWTIKDYLSSNGKRRLNEITKKYGEPQHPEFLSYLSEAFSVQEISPLSVSEISEKEPDELINYIKNWKPKEDHLISPIEVTHRGFARTFAEAFIANPNKYSTVIEKFAELPSQYISEIFSLAQSEIKRKKGYSLERVALFDGFSRKYF